MKIILICDFSRSVLNTRSYPALAPRPQIRIISFSAGCVLLVGEKNLYIISGEIYDKLYCCRTRRFHRGNTPLSYRINPCLLNHPVSRKNIFYQYCGLYCYRFCCHARLKRINSESKARTFLKDWNLWGIYYLFNLCFRICNSDEKRTSESGFSLYVIEHPRGGRCYFYY